jgi:hypothetical protein
MQIDSCRRTHTPNQFKGNLIRSGTWHLVTELRSVSALRPVRARAHANVKNVSVLFRVRDVAVLYNHDLCRFANLVCTIPAPDSEVYILVIDIQEVKLHIYFITLLGFSHNSSISLLSNLSSLSD